MLLLIVIFKNILKLFTFFLLKHQKGDIQNDIYIIIQTSMLKNNRKNMNEEFGKVVSEFTTVRTTKEINNLLEQAREHILKSKNVKTTYARIIEVLVNRYLKEEGILKNNENE